MSSRNSAWLRRLAEASCSRTSRVRLSPERRSCLRGSSRVWVGMGLGGLVVRAGEAVRDELLIIGQGPDEWVFLQKGHGVLLRRTRQQFLNRAQLPAGLIGRGRAGLIEL